MVQQRDPVAKVGDELVLGIPAQPAFVGTARLFAAAVARHLACPEDRVEDLKVAMSEAVTNAVKAHREAAVEAPIEIRAHPAEDGVTFEVVDRGLGFDLHMAAADDQATPPAGLYEGSLGLTLIRSLFPGSEILRNEDRGMTVRFHVAFEWADQDED